MGFENGLSPQEGKRFQNPTSKAKQARLEPESDNQMTKFIVSSNPSNLKSALFGNSGTVEAEYGDTVVEGSVVTLAHHGPRSSNPPPCVLENQVGLQLDVVGLSHLDLDSLGGCMALLGCKPNADSFWKLAGFVDVNGPHKLRKSGANKSDLEKLYAYWAWSETHRIYPPRDGSVLDVTEGVLEHLAAIEAILAGDEELLAHGMAFKAKEDALNEESFIEISKGVILRSHANFVNHLYSTPLGIEGCAVVAFKETTGEITISLADPVKGVSCRDVAVALWGPESGGHAGIAGGPRSGGFALKDARHAVAELVRLLQ